MFERLAAGRISLEAAGELGRLHANGRVRDQLGDVIEPFTVVAEHAVCDQFVTRIRSWEHLADADGTHHHHDQAHTARAANFATLGDGAYVSLCA